MSYNREGVSTALSSVEKSVGGTVLSFLQGLEGESEAAPFTFAIYKRKEINVLPENS